MNWNVPGRSGMTAALLILGFCGIAAADTVVTFDAGTAGWTGIGVIEPAGGNPGRHYHVVNPDTFGITITNNTNPEFIGDYTATPSVTLSIDLKVEDINFFGSPVSRPWLVDLRDYDDPEPGYPFTSVWYKFADVSEANTPDWTVLSVTIDDTRAAALPPGWGGTGAETGLGEPILPADRTFSDVLAGVDEIVFTTFEPGFFYGFTAFDLRIDNIAIATAGPCPADLNRDGSVDAADLALLLGGWGPGVGLPADLNSDGAVNAADLALLLGAWGPC